MSDEVAARARYEIIRGLELAYYTVAYAEVYDRKRIDAEWFLWNHNVVPSVDERRRLELTVALRDKSQWWRVFPIRPCSVED